MGGVGGVPRRPLDLSSFFGTMTWAVTLPTLARSLAVVIERPIYQRTRLRAALRAACFNTIYFIVHRLSMPHFATYTRGYWEVTDCLDRSQLA